MTPSSASGPVRVLALGGSTRPLAASEKALRIAAAAASDAGGAVTFITGRDLMLPVYDTESSDRTPEVLALVEAFRHADGILISTPGYHGAVSGMIKNALDLVEDLRFDQRPYLDGRAVGLIAVAHGWQTAVGTLNQLRQITHALRGWPAPMGVAINDVAGTIGDDATTTDPAVARQLVTVGQQVVEFAQAWQRPRS